MRYFHLLRSLGICSRLGTYLPIYLAFSLHFSFALHNHNNGAIVKRFVAFVLANIIYVPPQRQLTSPPTMASNKVPQASPAQVGPGGFVQQVTYASAQPDSVTSSSSAIQSMAPPSFTPDVPNSSDAAMTPSAMVPLATTSSCQIIPTNANGKVFSHVEKNELHPTKNLSPADAINNTVERIINAAESREAAGRESSLAYGTSPSGGKAFEVAALHGGPFTAMELGQLSLHCTASASNYNNASSKNKVNYLGAWSSLDGDLLATLTPMLQAHVISALGIDLVGEGRQVIAKSMEVAAATGGGSKKRPVITVHQVSDLIYLHRVCVY